MRVAVVLAVLAAALAFWRLGLGSYLTLEYIKGRQGEFMAYYVAHRALVIALYMLLYVAVTGLSLPGATVLTLAGGGIFGLWVGVAVVSVASTVGATIACASARFVLSGWVERRFGERLAPMHEGLRREGSFYLFTLRLIPVFPFFVINLAMGLTRIPLRTFFLVSQAGMLPGTVVYVNAGREIAKIESASGILSPGLIASFVLIGALPLLARKLLQLYLRKEAR
jgi:uncharacterized membrane protein YdjX (TVP38/TMEM64 family)